MKNKLLFVLCILSSCKAHYDFNDHSPLKKASTCKERARFIKSLSLQNRTMLLRTLSPEQREKILNGCDNEEERQRKEVELYKQDGAIFAMFSATLIGMSVLASLASSTKSSDKTTLVGCGYVVSSPFSLVSIVNAYRAWQSHLEATRTAESRERLVEEFKKVQYENEASTTKSN